MRGGANVAANCVDSHPVLMKLAASPANVSHTTCARCELGTVVELPEPRFHHLSNGDAAPSGWFVRIQLDRHRVGVHTLSPFCFIMWRDMVNSKTSFTRCGNSSLSFTSQYPFRILPVNSDFYTFVCYIA